MTKLKWFNNTWMEDWFTELTTVPLGHVKS